ncbi:hypothetical protein PMAYCL1PPCAC_14871, partial [Pristionchus mayeri]
LVHRIQEGLLLLEGDRFHRSHRIHDDPTRASLDAHPVVHFEHAVLDGESEKGKHVVEGADAIDDPRISDALVAAHARCVRKSDGHGAIFELGAQHEGVLGTSRVPEEEDAARDAQLVQQRLNECASLLIRVRQSVPIFGVSESGEVDADHSDALLLQMRHEVLEVVVGAGRTVHRNYRNRTSGSRRCSVLVDSLEGYGRRAYFTAPGRVEGELRRIDARLLIETLWHLKQ